jgi:hypothetical protein
MPGQKLIGFKKKFVFHHPPRGFAHQLLLAENNFSSFFSKMTKVLLEADSGREFLSASPQVQQSEIYASSPYPGMGKSTAKSFPSPGGGG